MNIAADVVVLLVAVLHIWFLIVEMFLWNKSFGLRTFGMSKATADSSAVLAANQGLYNGFLAAGLVWGLWSNMLPVKLFFLACVIIAGLFGGLTARRSILYFQALPGLVALLLVLAS